MTAKRIKQLLDRKDRLEKQLRQVELEIARGSRDYWRARGCVSFPRPERLRHAIEAEIAA
jgi:hypothetical protein